MQEPYVGIYHAFEGLGGFEMEQGIHDIELIPAEILNEYDVTGSVQILMNVRIFNEKLGLYKELDNLNIISTAFNETTGTFPVDNVTITAAEFLQNVHIPNVFSIGKLETLYTDFIQYVNDYFSYASGCSLIFNPTSQFDINNGIFDAEQFITIINGRTPDATGQLVQDLSGQITVYSVNQLIRDVALTNPFGNRPTGANIRDGFIEGDLIFIPMGIMIYLNVVFMENGVSINDLGVRIPKNECFYKKGYFSTNTTITDTYISMNTTVPLLIKLINNI